MTGPEQHAATVERLADTARAQAHTFEQNERRIAAVDELVALAGRADELQRELDEIADLTTQEGRQEQNIRSLYKGREQARREAVQLRAALMRLRENAGEPGIDYPKALADQIDAALAGVPSSPSEVEQLRAALRKYGRHGTFCEHSTGGKCDCGLDAALAGVQADSKDSA